MYLIIPGRDNRVTKSYVILLGIFGVSLQTPICHFMHSDIAGQAIDEELELHLESLMLRQLLELLAGCDQKTEFVSF